MKPDCPHCPRPTGWRTVATAVAALLAAFYLVQTDGTPSDGRVAISQFR